MTSIKTWHLTCVFQIAPCFDCSLGVSLMCELVTTVPPRKSQSFKPEMNEGHLKFLRKSHNFNEKTHFSKLTLIRLHQGMLSFHIIVCIPFCTGYGDEYCENNGKSLFERHLFYWFYRICDRFCTQINFFFVIYRPAFFLELFDKSSTIKGWK